MATDWTIYDYEVGMYNELFALQASGLPLFIAQPVRNAVLESLLLHVRILVEILLSQDQETDAVNLRTLIPAGFTSPSLTALKDAYGTRDSPGSPRYLINKRLAHSTDVRGNDFNWREVLNNLHPLITSCLEEIDAERKKNP
jgi:hypothetical protein